ncbi:4Fe-4S binding protein [Desulfovibrio cuneatus]|uniref:4Fe-4S binding protein n=1 Tax=Desulfovibrio cuneatus TaxID=159728 RepID=UPI0004204150|nr:4Fe-4S binding protein [Desulfovibrio cuneatus]
MLMGRTIIKNLLHKYATRLHPYEQRILPDKFRGRFRFIIDKCIMCRNCAVKCPTKCITIDPETGLWEREVMACVYCGVCADVCPTGCIIMTNVYRPPITEPTKLTFMCTPRPKKKKPTEEAQTMNKKDVETAIKQQQAERTAPSLPVSEE